MRSKIRYSRIPPSAITAYLGLVLVFCKSAGSLVYGIVVGFLIIMFRPSFQIKIACALVSLTLLYPFLRLNDLFPTKAMVEISRSINDERARSLEFRFENEEILLAHAKSKLLFGWGRYGRNRVYDEETGKDIGVTDGLWIIVLGSFGLVGFLAQFGLLSLPVLRALGSVKYIEAESDKVLFSGLALIVGLTVVEQLPNASISPWSWLLAGALLGRTELLRSRSKVLRRPNNTFAGAELRSPIVRA